jgi:hypothetical protein
MAKFFDSKIPDNLSFTFVNRESSIIQIFEFFIKTIISQDNNKSLNLDQNTLGNNFLTPFLGI